ncbi:MAG: ATP-binding protein [Candidatus Eiseniibacteriota bacterium]|nr:MAG: ATP-binding protein [Candidatus Eisenbacteria bacterium]
MAEENGLSQVFEITGKDFGRAGTISTKIKEILQEIGIDSAVIRRAAIAAYEAEMNIVMYAQRGTLTLTLTPTAIRLDVDDEGPGIEDIELAMQEGFSTATDEMREMGFGAGMGLPNIRKNSDEFAISSTPGKGTSIDVVLNLNQVAE